ncbi:hypothetical protein CN204_20580 [Sinorhizobium meliloti]|uniref:P-type ATPase n=1 Tax=Rhizobium meliloti TaxID=382 RepID=UPI0009B67361|nr:hypothetical protein [Sinorhizobium meliloti]ARS66108.1 hypothetical protein SMRU11_01440 [Sinorhizobium meliloti RU11/001]MBP2471047.1 Cu+-exporting ATPase [Sinorhizobium meliloti]MCM5693583.1 hypothetical protein [Sinorhizobium meliloti]MDE3768679.1 hypothetical protein [Sinorhizobium meliloti]MDE3777694.1 hypothetical protein [Sinorhizobium meliloti]
MPVEKTLGHNLIGGTLNQSGLLCFTATRVGKDTALSPIIKLVEDAQASTAQVQRLADQVTFRAVELPSSRSSAAMIAA